MEINLHTNNEKQINKQKITCRRVLIKHSKLHAQIIWFACFKVAINSLYKPFMKTIKSLSNYDACLSQSST